MRLVISPEAVLSKKIRASKSTKETQKLTVKAHNGAAPARKLTR